MKSLLYTTIAIAILFALPVQAASLNAKAQTMFTESGEPQSYSETVTLKRSNNHADKSQVLFAETRGEILNQGLTLNQQLEAAPTAAGPVKRTGINDKTRILY